MTRVLVVDDPVTTHGLRRALADAGMDPCGAASSRAEAIALAAELAPDICLVGEGVEDAVLRAAADLALAAPEASVVLLVADPDPGMVLESLRVGARGCLPREIAPERLGPALCGVLAGELALTRRDMTRVVEGLLPALGRPVAWDPDAGRLSGREAEVLALLRHGLDTVEIAARLRISPVTVRRHASKVMRKAQVADRAALLR